MTTSTFTVDGMTCGHCVASVTVELSRLAGVTGVEVDLTTGRVELSSDADVDAADIARAVDEAGYAVAG